MKKQYYLNVKNAHHVRFISIILGEDIDKVFKLVDRTVNVNGKVVKLYGNDYLFRKKKREAIKKLLNKLAPDMRKHLNAMAKIMQELSTRQSKKNKKLADDFNKFYASYWSKYRKVHNLIFYNRRIPIGPGSKITEIIPHINPVCFDSEETYKKFRSLINAALRFYRHPTIPLKQPNRLRDDKMYRAKIKRWEATITKNQKIKGKKRITYWHLSLNDLKLADPNHPDGQKCTCRGCNLIKSHAKSIKQAVYEYRKNI